MQMSFRTLVRTPRSLALAALSLAIVGALAVPQSAHASAFQLKEDSTAAMGRAYAGSVTAGDDASVAVNNPAAMSDLKGTYFQADVTAINFSAQFSGSAHDAFGNPIGGGNGGDAGTTLPVPAMFFVTQINDKWHIGGGLTVPFGFQTEYNQNWVGRYNAVNTKLESLDATLSASYDITDNFSLGASVIAQRTSATLTSAINFNAVGQGLIQQAATAGQITPAQAAALSQTVGAVVPPGSDGYASVKGNDWSYGWQLGAYWKLTPNDKLGLNYHSRIGHTLEGTANFNVPDNVTAVLSNPAVAPLLAGGVPFQHTTGTAALTTPATADLSYWHQAETFGIGMDLAWTQWTVLKQLQVIYANPAQPTTTEPFNWRNTWYAAIGGDYYLTEKVTLRAGVSVDTTPTSATNRDPRVPDSTRKMVSVGIGYKASDRFTINASYAHIFVNQAHLDGSVSSTADVLTGNFDDYGNLLSLSAQYKF
ncbi:MAG: outer membrane protein transport protein [Rhodanobacter sp.]